MLEAITMQKPPIAAPHPSTTPESVAAAPTPIAAPVAPASFISPRMTFDSDVGMVITQIRDRSTGEVKNQFPAESVVRQYKQSDQFEARSEQPAPTQPSDTQAQAQPQTQTQAPTPGPGAVAGEAAGTDFSGTAPEQPRAAAAPAPQPASMVA